MSNSTRRTIHNPITSERITFLQTSKQTSGAKTLVEIEVGPKGQGPPLHFHKQFVEIFTMTKGEMQVVLNKKVFTLKEGETCRINKGEIHKFWSESEYPVIFQGVLEPGSEDFEHAITIMFGLAKDGYLTQSGIPKRIAHGLIIAELGDSNPTGFMKHIFSFIKLFFSKSKLKKEKIILIEKYCN